MPLVNLSSQEYQTTPKVMVLELRYHLSSTLHSQYAFFKPVNLPIIALDGRNAANNSSDFDLERVKFLRTFIG